MRYRTVSLSAYAGQHYTANYGTLAFVPGQTTTNVSVTASTPSNNAYKYQTGVHARGNDLYVSVAFNEPVTCSSVSLTTTWGTLSHNSGSGSNVLTFKGVFDGRGYTVSGIRIYKGGSGTADGKQGLFGRTSDGTVRNVTLADARITGSSSVGGIVGEAYGSGEAQVFVPASDGSFIRVSIDTATPAR